MISVFTKFLFIKIIYRILRIFQYFIFLNIKKIICLIYSFRFSRRIL